MKIYKIPLLINCKSSLNQTLESQRFAINQEEVEASVKEFNASKNKNWDKKKKQVERLIQRVQHNGFYLVYKIAFVVTLGIKQINFPTTAKLLTHPNIIDNRLMSIKWI